jgi:hypothetical protein
MYWNKGFNYFKHGNKFKLTSSTKSTLHGQLIYMNFHKQIFSQKKVPNIMNYINFLECALEDLKKFQQSFKVRVSFDYL